MSDSTVSFPIDESIRRRFETAWLTDNPPRIEDILPQPDSAVYEGTLAELIQIEMEFHWKAAQKQDHKSQGQVDSPPTVGEYLERFPQLDNTTLRRQLIQQEYLLRHKFGDSPDVAEYQRCFPDLNLDTRAIQSEFFPLQLETLSVTLLGVTCESMERLPQEIGSYQRRETRFTDRLGLLCDAYDTHIGDDVVLRMIDPQLLVGLTPAQVSDWQTRLRRTANKTARLRHAHIAQVVMSDQKLDVPLYVMNLPGSVPLVQVLETRPLEPRGDRGRGWLWEVGQS